MNQVLTVRDLSTLNKALSALNDLKQLRDRMDNAGIDTSEQTSQITYLESRLNAIKREFFPTHQ